MNTIDPRGVPLDVELFESLAALIREAGVPELLRLADGGHRVVMEGALDLFRRNNPAVPEGEAARIVEAALIVDAVIRSLGQLYADGRESHPDVAPLVEAGFQWLDDYSPEQIDGLIAARVHDATDPDTREALGRIAARAGSRSMDA